MIWIKLDEHLKINEFILGNKENYCPKMGIILKFFQMLKY